MACKMVFMAIGLTTVLLYGRAPARKKKKERGVSRLAR